MTTGRTSSPRSTSPTAAGAINGYGWAGMNLVGQLVLSLPVVWIFGDRIGALQVEVAMLGVVGLLAALRFRKAIALAACAALFIAMTVAVGPMWASLSASYMTDIPTFALVMICRAVGARPVRGDQLNADSLDCADRRVLGIHRA